MTDETSEQPGTEDEGFEADTAEETNPETADADGDEAEAE